MKRAIWITAALLVVSLPLVAASKSKTVPLKAASMIVEINATDGDAGLQPFLDGEPWKRVVVYRPDGEKLFDVRTRGVLRSYGLTELFSESSEPPFTEFSLDEFKKLFPAGDYRFVATSIQGERMVGTATLTHNFPEGPEILSPEEEETVTGDVVVEWAPVEGPAGIVIAGYQVLVIDETSHRVLSLDLPADAESVLVPSEFLDPGTVYKVEVLAVEVGGNKTLSEVTFTTA